MATNNKKYLLLAIILFGFLPILSAQTAGYFIEGEGDEVKVFQRFVWNGGEYALRYEVVFEKEIDGTYRAHLREFTTSQFIEVSLTPGVYRLRVIPYDILGRPAESSQWARVEILSMQEQRSEINLSFVPAPEPEPEIEAEPEPKKPEPEKNIFFSIGAVFGPQLPLYGSGFGDNNYPAGVGLRTSLVFKSPFDLYIGPEFTYDIYDFGNREEWKIYFFTIGLNLLFEKWFYNKQIGVGFKFGALYPSMNFEDSVFHKYHGGELDAFFHDSSMNVLIDEGDFSAERFITNMGASFYWLIKKHILLEIGFTYIHIFNTSGGYFRPMLGVSYQF
jgi:hypothetical protein